MPEAVGAKPAYLTSASVAQLAEVTGLDPAHVQVRSLLDAPYVAQAEQRGARLQNVLLRVRIPRATPYGRASRLATAARC